MADLRERKTKTSSKESEITDSKSTNTNTQAHEPTTEESKDAINQDFNQTTSNSSLENWNALSYWYNMQTYYQYYYSTCYLNSFYYWQLLACQGQQYDPGLATQFGESRTGNGVGVQAQAVRFEACEARISSIQKRILAELIDFFFLYFTKFLMFAIFYNSIDRYTQLQYALIIDENTNLKDIEEILVQALVYRFMVFAYEMFFLVGGFYGDLGGATPGKHIVGLAVMAADQVELLENNLVDGEKVRVLPAENPGWWRAGLRALVKNFSITFLFPVFLTIFFFNNSRTIYDVIAGTIVVDKKSIKVVEPGQQQQEQH